MKPKTIRIYSPFSPFSKTEGAHQVIANQIQALTELQFNVELVSWKTEPEPIGQRIYRVASSALSSDASPEVFYYPKSQIPAFNQVADLGIYHFSFSYPWLKKMKVKPEKKTAVCFHNLESDLFKLRAKTSPWFEKALHHLTAFKLARHETLISKMADELWFLSAVDQNQYLRKNPSALTRRVGPCFSKELFKERSLHFQANQLSIGIIGQFGFEPNRASLEWIIHSLAPELKKRAFTGQILVAGKNVPQKLIDQAQPFGFFKFLGFVKTIEEFWNPLSFLLVPHISGSGIRIKLLEALASGVPVIANPAAIEPLEPSLQNSPFLFSSNSASEWADRIVNEPTLRTRQDFIRFGFPSGLLGSEIFQFLLADSFAING